MADVIEDAIRTHVPFTLAGCFGCDWYGHVNEHPTHLADAVRVAVLEVTEAAVYDAFSFGPPPQAHDIVANIAAALAGEG